MNDEKFNNLIEKIDNAISHFSPKVPSSAESPHFAEFLIHKDTKVSDIPSKELPLVHVLLHTFYQNKSGKGLTGKSIESLHKDVVERLKIHEKYDKLDENV